MKKTKRFLFLLLALAVLLSGHRIREPARIIAMPRWRRSSTENGQRIRMTGFLLFTKTAAVRWRINTAMAFHLLLTPMRDSCMRQTRGTSSRSRWMATARPSSRIRGMRSSSRSRSAVSTASAARIALRARVPLIHSRLSPAALIIWLPWQAAPRERSPSITA